MIGILPAAGLGTRLRPFRYPKELLPVAYIGENGTAYPIVAAEWALQRMHEARVARAIVVVADWKLELIRVLGDGGHLGIPLAYINQLEARGLASAVDTAYDWVRNEEVALVLPDTIYTPPDALAQLRAEHERAGNEVTLGVFPTDQPEHLAPVVFDAESKAVSQVLEKPANPPADNTWGIAIWSPAFTEFLHARVGQAAGNGLSISDYFDSAVDAGFKVGACAFPGGSFSDLGSSKGVSEYLPRAGVDIQPR